MWGLSIAVVFNDTVKLEFRFIREWSKSKQRSFRPRFCDLDDFGNLGTHRQRAVEFWRQTKSNFGVAKTLFDCVVNAKCDPM